MKENVVGQGVRMERGYSAITVLFPNGKDQIFKGKIQ